ncbi:MAG: phosphate acyltransferase PlsX [Lentisphaerae bacterium]|nr:phosphate acyltransferase PlsX [Lentisphaerota bacterium]
MHIAVDAMGGDFAPREIVRGAVEAARSLPGLDKITLVGDEAAIRREYASCGAIPATLNIQHAMEAVGMEESPANAIRRKKDNSISRAVDLVKKGLADAMISAGNTGAVVVAATLKLRTLPGIDRPAIATVMPTPEKPFVLIDAGANTDCPARLLLQFAIMGQIYAQRILGCQNPRIGLMSVGTEESKGNEITKEAFHLLSEAKLNFSGNIEGHDLYKGNVDVAVCDGFVGNVILKTSESVVHATGHWIKQEFSRSPLRILGALLLTRALRDMKKRVDPDLAGGAPLLGVNGVCIISHGSSSARAIYHAIRVARDSVNARINELITQTIGSSS